MKEVVESKSFNVTITERGSKDTLPWYVGMAGKSFSVIKSKTWTSYYEIVSGKYKGRLIDPKHTNSNSKTL